mmetsp:Transcript_13480/g.41523  ORF Transcript_13480/g.41523 Transcript_13480/m.41523 type:complete len:210 (+) Transcript_13480:328-957(+)
MQRLSRERRRLSDGHLDGVEAKWHRVDAIAAATSSSRSFCSGSLTARRRGARLSRRPARHQRGRGRCAITESPRLHGRRQRSAALPRLARDGGRVCQVVGKAVAAGNPWRCPRCFWSALKLLGHNDVLRGTGALPRGFRCCRLPFAGIDGSPRVYAFSKRGRRLFVVEGRVEAVICFICAWWSRRRRHGECSVRSQYAQCNGVGLVVRA